MLKQQILSQSIFSLGHCLVSQPKNKLISNNEQLFITTDLLPIMFSIILPPNPCDKKSTNSQINLGTSDENKNSKVCTIEIFLDSCASASIVWKDVLHICHKILKGKKNKWSNMAEICNTTFVTEIISKTPGMESLYENLRKMPFDH